MKTLTKEELLKATPQQKCKFMILVIRGEMRYVED